MATQEADTANIKEDFKKKPGQNNPEEATRFVQKVDKVVQKFMDTVTNTNRIPSKTHIQTSSRNTSTCCVTLRITIKIASVLELIDDTACKIPRVETKKERTDQQLCKDPRISMDNIMQVHHVLNHLEALPGFKKFEGSEKFAISELFRSLQRAHNASAEVARHLAVLERKLQPSQCAPTYSVSSPT